MDEELRFNIGNIKNFHLMNDLDLVTPTYFRAMIPGHLWYACHFWADHLLDSDFDQQTVEKLEYFLKKPIFLLARNYESHGNGETSFTYVDMCIGMEHSEHFSQLNYLHNSHMILYRSAEPT